MKPIQLQNENGKFWIHDSVRLTNYILEVDGVLVA